MHCLIASRSLCAARRRVLVAAGAVGAGPAHRDAAEAPGVPRQHAGRLGRRHRPRRLGRGRAGADRRRLRGHRGRQAADDQQLHVRGDLRAARKASRPPTCWPRAEARLADDARARGRPRPRRPRRARPTTPKADDLGGAGRTPPDRPALRHQLDAARGRAARRRLGDEVRQREDEPGRHGRGRDRQLDARRADGLHGGPDARWAAALAALGYKEGTATPPPSADTVATDEQTAADDSTTSEDTAAMDMFNNDVRLRALKALAETLAPIEQKKSILYFSAGMQRSGDDNQVELRAAINAAVRAHVAIYPVDTRGLQAVVPGGDASQASGRGSALFSGRGVVAAVLAAHRVAGHARVARLRHRRQGVHGLERLRRGVRARAARHVRLLPARLQQRQPRARTAASAASASARRSPACGSRRAPATTPTATSRTPRAAIAKRSCRSSSSPRSRRPTCRCS